MPIFNVFKKEWDVHSEHRGLIIIARDWTHAKGIAMDEWGKGTISKNNIEVLELDITTDGVICSTDWVSRERGINT